MRKQFNLGAKAKISQYIGAVEEEIALLGPSLPATWKALSSLPHAEAMGMGN